MMRRVFSILLAVLAIFFTAGATRRAEADSERKSAQLPHTRNFGKTAAQLVQFRWQLRRNERDRYKALEEYYDDLEDAYDDVDPALADHFERLENYYEDLRKGRAVGAPPPELPDRGLYLGQPAAPPIRDPSLQERQHRFAAPPLPDNLGQRVLQPHEVLVRSYEQLQAELSNLSTEQQWKNYLTLPIDTLRQEESAERLQSRQAKQALQAALANYDRAEADEQYDMVTQLPGFRRTHAALRSLIRWLDEAPSAAVDPEPSPVEEIPAPTG